MTYKKKTSTESKKDIALINKSQNIRPNANLPVWIGAPAAYGL